MLCSLRFLFPILRVSILPLFHLLTLLSDDPLVWFMIFLIVRLPSFFKFLAAPMTHTQTSPSTIAVT